MKDLPHAGTAEFGVLPRTRLAIFIAIGVLLSVSAAAWARGQQRRSAEQHSYRARVDLVIANVAVFDQFGVPVDDLARTDFEVFDNEEAQQIAVFLTPRTDPLTIAFALDFSESVRPAAPRAREAATTFLHALSGDDCVFVLPFQSNVARGRWVPGADPEIGGLLGLIPFEGGTALYDAIKIGLDKLERVDAETRDPVDLTPVVASGAGPGRRRALVVLTDGNDQHSVATYEDILLLAQRTDVPVFPVTVGGAADPFWQGTSVGRVLANKRHAEQLQELAATTGGMIIRSNSRSGLPAAYEEVLNALRASYVIGYYMPATAAESRGEADAWHDLDVVVSRPGLRVQARPGYRAPLPSSPAPGETGGVAQNALQARPSYSGEVHLATVAVTVTDQHRAPITDLTLDDFEVLEDGRLQDAAFLLSPLDTLLEVAVLLDTSGSIGRRVPEIRPLLAAFLRSLDPDDCVLMVPFSDTVGPAEGVGELVAEAAAAACWAALGQPRISL